MLIKKIKADERLKKYVREQCCENNVAVSFSSEISKDNIIIIKIDDFYNDLNLNKCPAAIDCLIIQKCENGKYSLTLVELKSITSSSGFTLDNIKEKYDTCFRDFMVDKFKEYFNRDFYKIKLYFVTNIELYKRDLGLKLEILIQYRFNWRGKKYMIDPRMPVPEIKKC